MESPILGWNAYSWVSAGENVLDSIPSPAMAILGNSFSVFFPQLIKMTKNKRRSTGLRMLFGLVVVIKSINIDNIGVVSKGRGDSEW